MSSSATRTTRRMPGRATAQGTLRYAARFQGRAAAGHFREVQGGLVFLPSASGRISANPIVRPTRATQAPSSPPCEGGFNVVDSAINYRLQRSERAIGGAALQVLCSEAFSRDEIVLCTKAGFLTPDGEMPADAERIFFARVSRTRNLPPGRYRRGLPLHDAGLSRRPTGSQPPQSRRRMRGRFLSAQSGNAIERSSARRNFAAAIQRASHFWNPRSPREKSARTAWPRGTHFAKSPTRRAIFRSQRWRKSRAKRAAPDHHFRFVQLPLNLAMPEALLRPNQIVEGKTMAMVQAARALGITLVSSAALVAGAAHAEFAALY